MYRIGLIVEYSRMQVPSLSRGCEIAQFFVRHTAVDPSWQHHSVSSTDTSTCYHFGAQKIRTFGPRVKHVWKSYIRKLDNNKSKDLGMLMHQNGFQLSHASSWIKRHGEKITFLGVFLPKSWLCCYRVFLSTIFMPFSTEAWKCDFLLATMHAINIWWVGRTHPHAIFILWLWIWSWFRGNVRHANHHWSRSGMHAL